MSIVVKSGKGLNQLGLYEGWNAEKNLEYGVLVVRSVSFQFGYLTIGLWVPKKWNQKELFI